MCLILMICISLPTHAKEHPEKPNFVIVLADDISADSFGCFGSPNPYTTPHIDKLAASGIRFKNMFVSEAMCAPCPGGALYRIDAPAKRNLPKPSRRRTPTSKAWFTTLMI